MNRGRTAIRPNRWIRKQSLCRRERPIFFTPPGTSPRRKRRSRRLVPFSRLSLFRSLSPFRRLSLFNSLSLFRSLKLRIPAATFNTFIDAAQDYLNRRHYQGGRAEDRARCSGLVRVKNNSGGDCQRFDILGIDTPVFDPANGGQAEKAFTHEVVLSGVTPILPDHQGKFLILQEPLAAGKIGWAAVSGVSVVWLDVQEETDQFAEISDGETVVLTTGTCGSARILWKPPGTGEMWGIVRLPDSSSPLRWGVATADWDGSNTITLTPCKGADDETETGEEDVDCTVVSPTDATPAAWISQGDILAYLPTGEGEGVLLPVATGLIPVSLQQDGGEAGDYVSTCSFTYTLTATGESEPLDTGVSPQGQRLANCPYEQASVGLAINSGESSG